MKIIIPVNSFTYKLINPHVYLFKKYWKNHPDILFLGYKKSNEQIADNCYFINHCNDEVPAHQWSSFLLNFLENEYSDKSVLFYLDDTFLVREVNSNVITECQSFVENQIVYKFYLNGTLTKTNGCSFIEQDAVPIDGVVKITNSSMWKNSLQSCIWNTQVLKNELKKFPNSTNPWNFEECNLDNSSNIFSFSHNYPMMVSHVYRRRSLIHNWDQALSEYNENSKLSEEDVRYIKNFL
jgi:hypothetical protein